MNQSGKIVIAYCSPGTVTRQFHTSLSKLYEFDARANRLIKAEAVVDGCNIDDNRNSLAEQFLAMKGAEWFWSIDTDHQFEPEAIYALYDSASSTGTLMTAALVFFEIDGRYTANWFSHQPDGRFRTLVDIQPDSQKIGGCGMACVMIHRTVFERIAARAGDAGPLYAGPTPSRRNPRPWFDRLIIDTEATGYHKLGEDLSFCARAAAAGIEIRGEGRVCIDHKRWQWENLTTYRNRLKAIAWDKQGGISNVDSSGRSNHQDAGGGSGPLPGPASTT